jgi:hypothetical protein
MDQIYILLASYARDLFAQAGVSIVVGIAITNIFKRSAR